MSDSALQNLVEGARAYEALFVPALFGQWATPVIEAARLAPGHRVLDVACGTGVVARKAVGVVGPTGQVAGIDRNPGMLVVAAEQTPEVDWQEGLAEGLPFADASFDAAVNQFGLMFFRDRAQALAEMGRVTKPRGRVVVVVWDAVERQSGFSVQLDLIERHAGAPAAEASRAPFVLGDVDELTTLFGQAGMQPSEVETRTGRARFPSIRTMVEAELRGWLPVMGVHLAQDAIETILAEAEDALRRYRSPSGTIEFDVRAHVVTVRQP